MVGTAVAVVATGMRAGAPDGAYGWKTGGWSPRAPVSDENALT